MFLKRHVEGVLWSIVIGLPYLAVFVGPDLHRRHIGLRDVLMFMIAVTWVLAFAVVLPLHFYRAWRRWPQVPNRRSYAAWVGFETATAAAIVIIVCYNALIR